MDSKTSQPGGGMQGKKLLHSIRLTNLLSYGSEGVSLDLEPLNVLIGPNASGKSNLIEAISLLAAAPRDLLKPLRQGGGTAEWIWKGGERAEYASLTALVDYQDSLLDYELSFTTTAQSRFSLADESVNLLRNKASEAYSRREVYGYNQGTPAVALTNLSPTETTKEIEGLSPEQSVLAQLRGLDFYPELTYLGIAFANITFFREWGLGRFAAPRLPQRVDLPDDFLLEDASNLGLVLNDLQNRRVTKRLIVEKLQQFYEGVEDITTKVQGGTIQIFVHEKGLREPIPASRLSDGTLHYICLLTILLHPEPPPLICIEEPELGLHPDIIPIIAELLIDASQRTQLIVTTHSDTLVSALSEVPEAVVVCERDDHGTKLRRLDPEDLKEWLESYRLGDLWAKGEIGGNRW
ncbi:MAG TPA: AAA family ATPase [Thermoanaerobaculia bacterium]|nr:AAA family ATPase [Thermoanaerobaculia bacterium]